MENSFHSSQTSVSLCIGSLVRMLPGDGQNLVNKPSMKLSSVFLPAVLWFIMIQPFLSELAAMLQQMDSESSYFISMPTTPRDPSPSHQRSCHQQRKGTHRLKKKLWQSFMV